MKKKALVSVFLLVTILAVTTFTVRVSAESNRSVKSADENPLLIYLKTCSDKNRTPSVDDYVAFLQNNGVSVVHTYQYEPLAVQMPKGTDLDSSLVLPQSVQVLRTLVGPAIQSNVVVGPTQNHFYSTLPGKLIVATASLYWPIISFVDALVGSIDFPKTVYGNVSSVTTNTYVRLDMWYEIQNQYGQWEPFVITQYRQTNLSFSETVTSTAWPYPNSSASADYTGLRYQTSYRWDNHSANDLEAVDRYYRGWGLQVYTYDGYGSTNILNTHLLP